MSFLSPVYTDMSVELTCTWSWLIPLEKRVVWYRQTASSGNIEVLDTDNNEQKFFHKYSSVLDERVTLRDANMVDEGEYWCSLKLDLFSNDPQFVYVSNNMSLAVIGKN